MTRDTIDDAAARRYTCSIIGCPSMSASGLPGNRVEANRAGMTATTLSESTRRSVDAGRTTNNSIVENWPCYDPNAYMNFKRTATIVVLGGAFAAWLSAAIAPMHPE